MKTTTSFHYVLPFVFTSLCSFANASEPYCGLYAIYGAAEALGVDADLQDLVNGDFVSSRAGSSTSDLQRAAESLGLVATPVAGVGRHALVNATCPLLLHVSPEGVSGKYSHWLLYLGIHDSQAVVYDGSGGIRKRPNNC